MKIVGELFYTLNMDEVLDRLFEEYPYEVENTDGYKRAWEEICALNQIKTDVFCYLEWVSIWEEPKGGYVHVAGRKKCSDQSLAIEFTPWEEWLYMPIKVAPELDLDEVGILAHILWEMTWFGYTQDDVQDVFLSIMNVKNRVTG